MIILESLCREGSSGGTAWLPAGGVVHRTREREVVSSLRFLSLLSEGFEESKGPCDISQATGFLCDNEGI